MKSTRSAIIVCAILATSVFVGIFGVGCTEQPTLLGQRTSTGSLPSYTIPITIDTFNVGNIHNALLYYIFTHYDTTKYASYPNYFSEAAIDSLAHQFIQDSLQPSSGTYTSAQIAKAEGVFDSTFHASMTAYLTRAQMVASIDTAKAHGVIASDEATFLSNADSLMSLCGCWAEFHDTVKSLIAQYKTITWLSSPTHGTIAFGFLSIASHSANYWGQTGDTMGYIAPHPAHPAESPGQVDAEAYAQALLDNLASGASGGDATEAALMASAVASASVGASPANPWVVAAIIVLSFALAYALMFF